VTAGKADITSSVPEKAFPVPPSYAAQLRLNSLPWTVYLALDNRQPPFDDIRVRRALNLAMDRKRAAQLVPGGALRRPTCQVLPPSFPGYRPYCPYTIDPGATGAWSAPDMVKALELVKASGTSGMTVEQWYPRKEAGELGRYVARVLHALGYRVRTRFFDEITAYFGKLQRAKHSPQVGFAAWAADYPAPSNFVQMLLTCRGPVNFAHFCDHAYDRKVDRALRLQPTDPAGANAAWAELDRQTVDRAVWTPMFSVLGADLVSRRVGNYQFNPALGPLLDQLWVR
jgi:peptide/nickel transport system substrate-binding protein